MSNIHMFYSFFTRIPSTTDQTKRKGTHIFPSHNLYLLTHFNFRTLDRSISGKTLHISYIFTSQIKAILKFDNNNYHGHLNMCPNPRVKSWVARCFYPTVGSSGRGLPDLALLMTENLMAWGRFMSVLLGWL